LEEITVVLTLLLWALVPGLPIGLLLTKPDGDSEYAATLVASPLISIAVTFIGGNFLNRLGFFPKPIYILVPLGILLFAFAIKKNTVHWKTALKKWSQIIVICLPSITVGAFVWIRAFERVPFVAPNQDGFNHNLWIRRAIELNSFRSQDLKVDSALAQVGSGSGIYPFGWHTSVSSWAPLAPISPPTFALLTVAILWVVFLPLGISLAMKVWLRDSSLPVVPATIAATTFVQVLPILPGVPLSWGSMTSIIGISFLPLVFSEIVVLSESQSLSRNLYLGILLLGLVVVHPPEAATAFLFFGLVILARFRTFTLKSIAVLVGVGLSGLGAAAYIYRGFLTSGIDYIRQYWGAAFPDPTWALGSFFSLSIRVPGTGMAIAVLFVSGIIVAAREIRSSAPLFALIACLGPYLLSGGSTEPLATMRILSMPWYASYERTLWITVPFAAIFAGISISKVWSLFGRPSIAKVISHVAALILFFLFVHHQLPQAVRQMREGIVQSMVVFEGDKEVYQFAGEHLEVGKVIFSVGQDGGSYGYMYAGLPVTYWEPLDLNGTPDDYIATLGKYWKTICTLDGHVLDEIDLRVSGLLISERSIPWGTPGTSRFEVMNLEGYAVRATGESVFYLEIDLTKCLR